MVSSNNRTNNLIKWVVIVTDFLLMNLVVLAFSQLHPRVIDWGPSKLEVFWLACNLAFVLSQYKFSTIVHMRVASAGEVMQRVTSLMLTHMVLSYLIMKVIDLRLPVGWILVEIDTVCFVLLVISRVAQRLLVKHYRVAGRNTRTVTFVGADPEQQGVYEKLIHDPTIGYKPLGYYGEQGAWELTWLGTVQDLLDGLSRGDKKVMGDDMFVCLSRREATTVRALSKYCDQQMTRFFYVPVSLETFGINLKREFLDDIELFTTYEMPLVNPVNKALKRTVDILLSALFLIIVMPFFPIVALIIKWQSPGPIFFRQLRTGHDGREFYCYKLRSMHVNKDADTLQATKDDPRKFAFGNFMRKTNIDELPQFWNVLKGDMSIVGPRPHMLAHTEMYSQLIDKYMVRHYVKPGVTGWAQVTGFRGETRELWQMEGRVKRDIWYMEHWSIWLDIRIIWLTIKSMVVRDKNAY